MRLIGGLAIVWMIVITSLEPAGAAELVIYTETYPPFNHLSEAGEVVGLSTEKVRQVMDASGLKYSIKLVPWARAVLYAQTKDNALIYSIARTPDREAEFDWLAPLARSHFYLYVRAQETRVVTPEALLKGDFTAACVTSDLACELIRLAGVPEDKVTMINNNTTGDFRMVAAGRADLYVSNIMTNDMLREHEGFDPAVTKPAMRLDGKAGFYLAGGLKVPNEARTRIREAYENLVASGAYDLVDSPVSPH